MTPPLILIGSGGLARETAEAAHAAGRTVLGFLDDDESLWGTTVHGLSVLGGSARILDEQQAFAVLCPGKGAARLRIAERLREQGFPDERFATVVHPTVRVAESCSIGAGSVLLAGTVLTADVRLGRHVVCMPNAVLTHDDVVEDGATLCASAVLGGSVVVGSRAYLGMSCSVRERVRIGADATIGMGAVVLRDVPAGQTWAGVPAVALAPAAAGMTAGAGSR
jgi:sugar O-acyltransferase (sialic acid O-acetyltransferase NeuD family)